MANTTGFFEDKRRRFLDEVKVFIAACGKEQQARIAGEVLDYEPYVELRLGTSAVYTLCALVELRGHDMRKHIMNIHQLTLL